MREKKMTRGSTSLFRRVVQLRSRIDKLEDALKQTIRSAHDAGRVASGGKLHPTNDYQNCPSMLCEYVVQLLVERGEI